MVDAVGVRIDVGEIDRGKDLLFPFHVAGLGGEAAPGYAAKGALVVHVVAVVGLVRGEGRVGVAPSLRQVEVLLAAGPPLGGGDGVFDAVFGAVADGNASFAGGLVADGEAGLGAHQVAAGFWNHVYSAVEGAAAVNGGPGAADKLDAIHHFEIEDEIGADGAGLIDRVVHPVPVEEDERAGIVVVGAGEAAIADVVVETIVADVESRRGSKRVGQRAPAVIANVVGGENGDPGRCLTNGLLILRHSGDGFDRQLHKLLERELGEGVGGVRRRRELGVSADGEGQEQKPIRGAASESHDGGGGPGARLGKRLEWRRLGKLRGSWTFPRAGNWWVATRKGDAKKRAGQTFASLADQERLAPEEPTPDAGASPSRTPSGRRRTREAVGGN